MNVWVAWNLFHVRRERKKQMKKNKPRWKNLDMWERLARRCKQNGASEDTVEHIREHGKQREIEKIGK